MKIKIYNKKAPLSTFEALNQRSLEEMVQSGSVYNKGLTNVLSETLKRYENLQNAVDFTLSNFNPRNYFTLKLPELDAAGVLQKMDSAKMFQSKDSENDVSLLDFSDYNIDLRDIKVVNKFNERKRHETIESENDATLGEIIDLPDDSCLNLLEDVNSESKTNRNFKKEISKRFSNSDLCEFKLFQKKSLKELKENKETNNEAHTTATSQFGRHINDSSSVRSRKSSNVLTSKNMAKYKNSGIMTPLLEYNKQGSKQKSGFRGTYDSSSMTNSQVHYYTRTKTPNPMTQNQQQRLNKSGQHFLSPSVNGAGGSRLPFGSCFKTAQDFKSRLTSNCNSGARTPIKFGKSMSKKELNGINNDMSSRAGMSSRKKNNRIEAISYNGSGQKMRFSSKSPLFARLKKNVQNSNRKSKAKYGIRERGIGRESPKRQFLLSESSKRLLAMKPSRSTIPARYHQQLIKLIDGYGSKFDFSGSRKITKNHNKNSPKISTKN